MGDTICAIATASGRGGVAIIRISGPDAERVLNRCFLPAKGDSVRPGHLVYGHVIDSSGNPIDEAMAALMKSPHSYTREDVAEIQCHGGNVNAGRVLDRALSEGARLAGPGEFTKRAFMNGRIDLSQAEAVMELVGATGAASARAASSQLSGGVSRLTERAAGEIVDMLSLIAACDDFPEEIEESKTARELIEAIARVSNMLNGALDERRARLIRNGAIVSLSGRPNTGKSSLMNALLKSERAIVTGNPGTTRDILTEAVEINGLAVTLTDTAGQRDSRDQIEKIGVKMAREAEKSADMVLAVLDGSQAALPEDIDIINRADERYLMVINKRDLPQAFDEGLLGGRPRVYVSALTGEGVEELESMISDRLAGEVNDEALITGRRQTELCKASLKALNRAKQTLKDGVPVDIASVDLEQALEALWSITGKNARESVIDQVFANFCVGK